VTAPAVQWRYGLLALPLAFVALPLYVQLPNHYATQFGMPLAWLGAVLLAARLLDACLDPWIGRVSDRLLARSPRAVLIAACVAGAAVVGGFALLFFPPVRDPAPLLGWAGAWLVITYLAYSALTVSHQSWGARLGADDRQRSRIFAWREGFGLAGVLLALVLPAVSGWTWTSVALAILMAAGCAAWSGAPRPATHRPQAAASSLAPLREPAFRRLLAVFVLNGVATAMPATLVLFFVQDRLQAASSWEPAFLGAYFASGALSMPLWTRAVDRFGLAPTWMGGMLLSGAAFVGAGLLGSGDTSAFLLVCVLSGLALGTDLVIPSALLAGIVTRASTGSGAEGLYFGWWNLAAKWNLAIAAGVSLPLLGLAGYAPGSRDPQALTALTLAYVVVPCLFKISAAALLYLHFIRRAEPS